MLLKAGSGQHQGKFLMLHKTVGSAGGEAVAFPTEGQEDNLGGATANHLEKKKLQRLKYPNLLTSLPRNSQNSNNANVCNRLLV